MNVNVNVNENVDENVNDNVNVDENVNFYPPQKQPGHLKLRLFGEKTETTYIISHFNSRFVVDF